MTLISPAGKTQWEPNPTFTAEMSAIKPHGTLYAGDTHGNMDHCFQLAFAAEQYAAARVVQLGDFGYGWNSRFVDEVSKLVTATGIPWHWIDGNHENFDKLEERGALDADGFVEIADGVWYIPRGTVWQWDDLWYFAMGGAYSVDKGFRTPHIDWWPQETARPEDLERGIANLRALAHPIDVMLTHDVPLGVTVPGLPAVWGPMEPLCAPHRAALRTLFELAHPRELYHGHYHVRYSTTLDDTAIEGLNCDGTGAESYLYR